MRIAMRPAARPMHTDDIAQVLEIERESFPTMWPPTAYKRELEQNRLAHYLVTVERNDKSAADWAVHGAYGHGAEHPGAIGRLFGELRHLLGNEGDEAPLQPLEERVELITGVIGVWLLADEAHIVTIAVRESHRRQGIAELLLIRAIELAQAKEQQLVTLECRVSNAPALALYDKYGFGKVGLRQRYYSDNHEDAYVLSLNPVRSRRFKEHFEALKAEHEQRWGPFDIEG
ncbi:MAG: ribosomal-protein-alanine N-acetyltransferase [Chloroflexi bacterium]|nr:MAG: ribosomal-protein-alanine N-acetyltransferase [Chloroflexota bacterium]